MQASRGPCAQAARRGTGHRPAVSCPSAPTPSLAPPWLPCPERLPSAAHPWPGQQSWAMHSHVPPSRLLKAQGLAPAAGGVISNLQLTPPLDTLGPSSQLPRGCKAEDAAATPTQGSAHHFAPPACLAAVPTPPQGCISQALGKEVLRNAELRRIVQPQAVFGAKQKGSGMLQTLCSGRRTRGVGSEERGAAEQEAASCRPFWNSEAMDSACPGGLACAAPSPQGPELYGGLGKAMLSPAVRGRGLPAPPPHGGWGRLPPSPTHRDQALPAASLATDPPV